MKAEKKPARKQEKAKRPPFHVEFAEKIIARLQEGTAPWQRPWHSGKQQVMVPHNPASGTVYRGMNRVSLGLSDFEDPRWMTFNQAQAQGMQIVKGSKATTVVYYQFKKEEDRLDEGGKPVLGEDGTTLKKSVELDKPIIRFAHVFNGEQIEGMPPLELTDKAFDWEPVDKAESILSASGATIKHDQSDRAFYSPMRDEIHLPPKINFDAPEKYYATALHELGHWTGDVSRLNRQGGAFGTELYAREELRAEIASWMLGQDIGVSHDPKQHTAYVQSWIKALKEDPYEIVRACRDAEQIKEYVLGLERKNELAQTVQKLAQEWEPEAPAPVPPVQNPGVIREAQKTAEVLNHISRSFAEASMQAAHEGGAPMDPAKEKTYLAVPYMEKNRAKALGARWDNAAKSWFAPEGTDLTPLKQWMPEKAPVPTSVLAPQEEFAQALQAAGLNLKGQAPVMDGKIHRVPLLDDAPGALNGSYCGYSDGVPNGWSRNFSTGEDTKWIATGHVLTEAQKQSMQAEMMQRREERQKDLAAHYEEVAAKSRAYFAERHPAPGDHAYLVRKGICADGLKVTPSGTELIVPLVDTAGEIRTLQFISEDGTKGYTPGGQKAGNFYLIGVDIRNDEKDLAQGEILLAEGVATGTSLHMATGKPVAVAFDSGNLEAVAKNLRAKFPNASITICADNDHQHTRHNGEPYNVGVEKAQQAALAVGGKVIVPLFTGGERARGLKDFNDLHASRGLGEVKEQVSLGLNVRRDKGRTLEVAL